VDERVTTKAYKFCKKILKDVSRSFALTIPMLDEVVRKEVLLTYLQDRLLDNFEDEVEKLETAEQKELMDCVAALFQPNQADANYYLKIIKNNAGLMDNPALYELTAQADYLYQTYLELEPEVQKISGRWLNIMNQGMQEFLTKKVRTFADLNDYCYYVAGTVGGFLTELIIYKTNLEGSAKRKLLANFNESGLFLQKVNIIRDIREDLQNRDKHFWPLDELGLSEGEMLNKDYQKQTMDGLAEMIKDVKSHQLALKNYYEALPEELAGYRKFYTVNNALALATLKKLENNPAVFYGNKPVKVSKLKFARILSRPEKYFYQQI